MLLSTKKQEKKGTLKSKCRPLERESTQQRLKSNATHLCAKIPKKISSNERRLPFMSEVCLF